MNAFSILSIVACWALASVTYAYGDQPPADDPIPVQTYRLEQLWKIDLDQQDDILIGEIEDIILDESGEIFVLDSQMANVKVFSNSGEYLRTLGREGDGPGEIRVPGDIVSLPKNRIGLVSKMAPKMATFEKEFGNPTGDLFTLGADGGPVTLARVKGLSQVGDGYSFVALVREIGSKFWHWRMYLGLYRNRGDGEPLLPEKIICSVGEAEGVDYEEEEYFALWEPWTIDSLGRIVVAPYWTSYTLNYYDSEGTLLHQTEYPYQQRDRTEKEKQLLLEKGWSGTSPAQFGIKLVNSKYEAVVRRIHSMADGQLWVQTGNSAYDNEPNVFRVYDILDQSGNLTAKAELQCQADDLVDRIYFGSDDFVLIVHGAERYVQNHRGTKKDALDYELVMSGYRIERILVGD